MSIFLPNGSLWGVSNAISTAFFRECLAHLEVAPSLADDIRFCVDAEVDTLDLRGKGPLASSELRELVARALAAEQGSDADHHAYQSRLLELRQMLDFTASNRGTGDL